VFGCADVDVNVDVVVVVLDGIQQASQPAERLSRGGVDREQDGV
jgi:hypothetical protein